MILLQAYRGTVDPRRVSGFLAFVNGLPCELRRVLWTTLEAQAKVFGVEPEQVPRSSRWSPIQYRRAGAHTIVDAEILTDGASLCVIVLKRSDAEPQQILVLDQPSENSDLEELVLEVFYVGSDLEWTHLPALRKSAADALGSSLEPHFFNSSAFNKLKAEAKETLMNPFPEERAAAAVLRDKSARTLAVAIKSSGGLLLHDLARQLPTADRDRTDELQTLLRTARLIQSEVVAVCTKTQAQTARAASQALLTEMSAQGLRCACGRPIAEERIEEALTPTDLGRSLLDKSRWLTILVVAELEAVGVPLNNILIEQQLGGDEIDCIANISGELVLFELKDKDFNLGNAYSFGAKIGIIRPSYSVIVSTEKIGNDAKDHFQRTGLARRTRFVSHHMQEETEVFYIEGIESIRHGIQRTSSRIYTLDAKRILDDVLPRASLDGISLLRLLEHSRRSMVPDAMLTAELDRLDDSDEDDELPF